MDVFTRTENQKQALSDAYAGILEAQAGSQVELVNNEDFLYWTLDDWDTTWLAQNGFPKPGFSEKMLKTLVPEFLGLPEAEVVRTPEQLDEVVSVVYQFRLNQGLEQPVEVPLGYTTYTEESYAMCSENTQDYAEPLIEYIYVYDGPAGPYTKYQAREGLLEGIENWLSAQ